MLTDARVCAALKCMSTTEQMQTHRDKHTNTAGPIANLSIKSHWRDMQLFRQGHSFIILFSH